MREREPKRPRASSSLMLATGAFLAGLTLAACGGSNTSAPTPTPPAAATATPAQASPAATAVTPGFDVALIDYQDPAGRYSVQVPGTWERQESPDTLFLRSPDLTTLTIFCTPGGAVATVVTQDQFINTSTQGSPPTVDVVNQVAGVPGRRLVWINRVLNRDSVHTAEYFEGKGCAWRVQLVTPAGVDGATLFERILASFTFTP
jgi:hypothetical protein